MTRIGLVGCGNWGGNILRDLLLLGCGVMVADTDAAARDRALQAGASAIYSRSGDLPECDGYIVATPIPVLTLVCASLLPRKRPIFSEKTLCLSRSDYDTLKNNGGSTHLYVMHKWHYHPGIEALRSISISGRIGKLEALHTVRHAWVKDFHGGDVFWTQAVHDLTIVKHILGHIPSKIRAIHTVTYEKGLLGSFNAILGSSPAVVMSVSGRHCNKVSGVTLFGGRGTASLRDAYDDHVIIQDEKGVEKHPIDTTFPLYLELKEFVDYVNGGRQPRCNLEAAWEVTEAILNLRHASGY